MQTATWVHIGYKLRGNVQISKSLPSNSALERRSKEVLSSKSLSATHGSHYTFKGLQ